MDDKYDKKVIISYTLPSISHARFEAFVTMIKFLRQMAKELYEKNEVVHVTETGERVVLASTDPHDSASNDPLRRTID